MRSATRIANSMTILIMIFTITYLLVTFGAAYAWSVVTTMVLSVIIMGLALGRQLRGRKSADSSRFRHR